MRIKSLSARRLISLLSASALVATLSVATLPAAAMAAAPPGPYFNGFENTGDAIAPYNGSTDTQAMFDVTRVSSGTNNITAAAGSWYAQAAQNPYNTETLSQFTRLGGYSSTFPAGGYTTSAAIYLDMSQATGSNDLRFDWDSAISDQLGGFRRDFIFNVGTDPTTASQFVMSASNNAPGWPSNPGRDPFTVSTSGWYTFQHHFYNAGAGVLAVDMSVLYGGTVLHTWTLSDPSDVIGSTVGGNRYSWLVDTDFATLALDNITRSGMNCQSTGFYRDGINLTAAVINPTAPVTGTVDATGCNIGVYYAPGTSGTVGVADISGANYYGVVVDRANVSVTGANIHAIGETQPNGSQHGVGVLYTTYHATPTSNTGGKTTGKATGTLSGSTITAYQKNGVVIYGVGAAVNVQNSTVTGYGQINYIAQNGIEIAIGATASVTGNTVSNNYYTPTTYTACGLLFYQAGGVKQSKNIFSGNETNVCNAGRGGGQFNP